MIFQLLKSDHFWGSYDRVNLRTRFGWFQASTTAPSKTMLTALQLAQFEALFKGILTVFQPLGSDILRESLQSQFPLCISLIAGDHHGPTKTAATALQTAQFQGPIKPILAMFWPLGSDIDIDIWHWHWQRHSVTSAARQRDGVTSTTKQHDSTTQAWASTVRQRDSDNIPTSGITPRQGQFPLCISQIAAPWHDINIDGDINIDSVTSTTPRHLSTSESTRNSLTSTVLPMTSIGSFAY